jgi:hypothetical protein
MVTIVKFEKKTNPKTNESYSVLEVQSDPEVLMSKAGRAYITTRKATIASSLDDTQAKALIGKTLPGTIEKVACTPFEVKLPNGKKAKISTSFQYSPEPVATE